MNMEMSFEEHSDDNLTQYSFGAWVQRRRKALDLTQKDLAGRVGLSPVTLTKIERDERRPSRQAAELLAAALLIPADYQEKFVWAARGERSVRYLPDPMSFPVFPERGVDGNRESGTLPQAAAAVPGVDPAPGAKIEAIPVPLTALVGRFNEIEQISLLLGEPDCRLLTLTGPGGVGKSRLALEAAHLLQERYPDGVAFVSLAPVTDAAYIPAAIAEVLGVGFAGNESAGRQIIAHLWGKHMLLVLDNFEHLLKDASTDWLLSILNSSPGIQLLVTSRERINLRGEWVFEIQGLPVPEKPPQTADEQFSSLALFLQSAGRVMPGYVPDSNDLPALVRICQLVDGLPLGIELAAAWVRVLSVAEIAAEIERSLDFLETTTRDLPDRHRSLRAVFDHSWQLLETQDQVVLRRLSVFRGGFDRQMASEIAGTDLAQLSALIDKSLVLRAPGGRYDLHELIRQYVAGRLQEAGEIADLRDKHSTYFGELARSMNTNLASADPVSWRERMDTELNNFRVALEWSLEGGSPLAGLELALELYRIWHLRGLLAEGRRWLEKLLDLDYPYPSVKVGHAHWRIASLARTQGDYSSARRELALAEGVARQLQQSWLLAGVLNEQCLIAMDLQDFEQATLLGEESLGYMRSAGDTNGEALLRYNLGRIHLYLGELQLAQDNFISSRELAERLQDHRIISYAYMGIGLVAINEGRLDQARACLGRSLAESQAIGDQGMLIWNLESLGHLDLQAADYERAVQLYACADQLRQELSFPLPQANRPNYDEALAALQAALSPERYAELWQQSQRLPVVDILQLAQVG
jgi:predicted ATPase/transcriptional regulator with XRE-family HTH domain